MSNYWTLVVSQYTGPDAHNIWAEAVAMVVAGILAAFFSGSIFVGFVVGGVGTFVGMIVKVGIQVRRCR